MSESLPTLLTGPMDQTGNDLFSKEKDMQGHGWPEA